MDHLDPRAYGAQTRRVSQGEGTSVSSTYF